MKIRKRIRAKKLKFLTPLAQANSNIAWFRESCIKAGLLNRDGTPNKDVLIESGRRTGKSWLNTGWMQSVATAERPRNSK